MVIEAVTLTVSPGVGTAVVGRAPRRRGSNDAHRDERCGGERQKAEIEARLANAPADMPDVHPNVAELYRAGVMGLADTLRGPGGSREAREDIRSLVGEVVLTPGEKRGEVHAVLRGDLLGILDVAGACRRPG